MKIYLISNLDNGRFHAISAAVVFAENEDQARHMNPTTGKPMDETNWDTFWWASSPLHVKVEYMGEAWDGAEVGVALSDDS